MKRPQTTSSKLYLLAWTCVVISMLFSVGEGLQLVPFQSAFELTSSLVVESSHRVSFFEHGPVDIPVQLRKRTKRDFTDFELPPTLVSFLPMARAAFCLDVVHTSNPPGFVAEFPGRAPPAS